MIAVIDYGVGNLRSVLKGFEHAGVADVRVTGDAAEIAAASGLVLPGVGAFRDAAARLRDSGLDRVVRDRAAAGVPLLGICLGMQLLMDVSYEMGEWEGLGLIPGTCEIITAPPESGLKVPHMGWNTVSYPRRSPLFDGIDEHSAFYFVHSYHCVVADQTNVIGTVNYGGPLVCAVQKGNVFGAQFHPEKSSTVGLTMLGNFGRIVADGIDANSAAAASAELDPAAGSPVPTAPTTQGV